MIKEFIKCTVRYNKFIEQLALYNLQLSKNKKGLCTVEYNNLTNLFINGKC